MADENRIRSFKNKGKDTEVSFHRGFHKNLEFSNVYALICLGNETEAYRPNCGAPQSPKR